MSPKFLSVDFVKWLHRRQLDRFGGSDGVRDEALLESAVNVPQASFGGAYLHEDIYAMAAAYAFHLAENQPFVDGNKRTALHAAVSFLALNGVPFPDDPEQRLYEAMLAIARHELDKAGLARVFRELLGLA